MAKWDFKIVGASFVKETVGSDVQFRSQSFMQPSFDLEGDKIVMKESGQYKTAIYFSQIGEIDGVAPTDIDDAYAKLLTLVENFNGGGATPPTFGQVLAQEDRVVKFTTEYTRTNDEILVENRLERLFFDANRAICNLDDSANLFPLYSSIPFIIIQDTPIAFTPISTDVRSNLGVDEETAITSVILNKGDSCLLVKIASDPIWFLTVVSRGVKLFTCGITQAGSSAPIISNARGAQGATFTRTRLSAGDYRITASKAIWTGALPCYFSDQSATVYTIVDVGINFIQYWFYYLEDASNLRVISLVSLDPGGFLDDILQYGQQITIKYID